MSTPTFYHADLVVTDQQCELGAAEIQHANTVKRLAVGQAVKVLNGCGLVGHAKIVSLSRREFVVAIQACEEVAPAATEVVVATAIPKGDRQRMMVESLTQLGVSAILPLDCEHSATLSNHKSLLKWPRYAIEAAKQSGNPWLPKIKSGVRVTDIARSSSWLQNTQTWLADATVNPTAVHQLSQQNHLVAIGPEGGFSESEVDVFRQLGFESLNLSGHILRTETAAIAAASLLQTEFA